VNEPPKLCFFPLSPLSLTVSLHKTQHLEVIEVKALPHNYQHGDSGAKLEYRPQRWASQQVFNRPADAKHHPKHAPKKSNHKPSKFPTARHAYLLSIRFSVRADTIAGRNLAIPAMHKQTKTNKETTTHNKLIIACLRNANYSFKLANNAPESPEICAI